jgi:hypothetical protein
MAISMPRAKALCNANELSLVRTSTRTELAKLSPAQIKQKITRARLLRDKWNDQARSQRRTTQSAQRARQTEDNARSAEKAELFAEVLNRFESQLGKLEARGTPAGKAKKKLAPRARSAKHRAERAEVRGNLKNDKLTLKNAAKKKTAKPKATKPAAEPVLVFPEPTSDPSAESTKEQRAAARPTRKKFKAISSHLTALEAARELQGLHVSKGQQLQANTIAKQARLRASGIVRVQKSTSAANKRRQAKRDSR